MRREPCVRRSSSGKRRRILFARWYMGGGRMLISCGYICMVGEPWPQVEELGRQLLEHLDADERVCVDQECAIGSGGKRVVIVGAQAHRTDVGRGISGGRLRRWVAAWMRR
eukprot:scaffold7703_cov103-Isochrysis_galbana.AAC.11